MMLYVCGDTLTGRNARKYAEQLLSQVQGDHALQVVDVSERPDVAEAERVMATPMLVSYVSDPPRRVIGDLSDLRQVMEFLDLRPLAS